VRPGECSPACDRHSAHCFDLERLLPALKRRQPRKMRDALAPFDCWERDLLDAACALQPAARGPLIDEQVVEADWSTDALMRAPRVGASIATSAGFLCASVILIQALARRDRRSVTSRTGRPFRSPRRPGARIVGTLSASRSTCAPRPSPPDRVAVDRLADHLRTTVIS